MDQVVVLGAGAGTRLFGQQRGHKHLVRPQGDQTILQFLLTEAVAVAPAQLLVQIRSDDVATQSELARIGCHASILRGAYTSSSSAVSSALAQLKPGTTDMITILPGDLYGATGRVGLFLSRARASLSDDAIDKPRAILALGIRRVSDQRPIFVTEREGIVCELRKRGEPTALVSLGARVMNTQFVRRYQKVAPMFQSDYEVLNHFAGEENQVLGLVVDGLLDIDDEDDLEAARSMGRCEH